MFGFGAFFTFTPVGNGKCHVIISGTAYTIGNVAAVTIAGKYGTGTAPANNAASSGTNFGTTKVLISSSVSYGVGFAQTAVVYLSPGTTYWFDMAGYNGSNTSQISGVDFAIIEL
jgi:hypothetical protein